MADDFLRRCLWLDLETGPDDRILKIGAVAHRRRGDGSWAEETFRQQGRFELSEALAALDRSARGAKYVLGHNLLDHDLPVLRHAAPTLGLLCKPVVDTLYLSPLAFPENPYHHLVKDYKLVKREINNPVADARLAARVFGDQWRSFAALAESEAEALAFYAFCFSQAPRAGGLAAVLTEVAGRPAMARRGAWSYVATRCAGRVCRGALRRLAEGELEDPEALAYAVAWLRVAGGNSVLPPWVRHRHPATVELLDDLREKPCADEDCLYCRETHEPALQLKRFFGFEAFRPEPRAAGGGSLQEAVAHRALMAEPLLAILATGAGKSICYQLPALVRYFRRGLLTVVISPLQALMKDQVDHLSSATGSACAAALYGLLTPPERGRVLEGVRSGDVALLYVAPEQLRNRSFRRVLEQREIAAWVLDEAHCLSKWGHDFRPDYLYAARFIRDLARRQKLPVPPVACFTATAKRDVKREILEHFAAGLGQALEVFESSVDRDELRFRVEAISRAQKLERIRELLAESLDGGAGSAVIYFARRRDTTRAAEYLCKQGVDAVAFHGGLRASDKREVLDGFVADELRVVCATNAFGMGIDKPDVRLVVHADVPGSLESYLQEAGRAGRDRRPSDCVLLFDAEDVETQFKLAASSRLSRRDLAQILRGLRRARRLRGEHIEITSGELLRDEQVETELKPDDWQADTLVKSAVGWLERGGFVERDENQTRVFQGKLRVDSLEEAKERLGRLRLSAAERRRWLTVLKALLNAGPDEGLTADELAQLPGMGWGPASPDDRETPGEKVLRILHSMTESGLLTAGLRLTAFVKPRGPGKAGVVFEALCRLERAMLATLAEAEPDAEEGGWMELSLRLLNQRLVDQGHRASPQVLRKLLYSISEDGKGLAGRRGSLELAFRSRHRYRARLLRSWAALREVAARRHALASVVLAQLLAKAPGDASGKVLVEIGSDELTGALHRDLAVGDLRDPLAAAERGLLFLHEQNVIQLQNGLAVFRQAMTIRVRAEAKGRRYSRGDYEPLARHYGERTFQIHVMARYAELGIEKVRAALGLVQDYFGLGKTSFARRHFAGESEMLRRATGQRSYREIVESLKNPAQMALVAAPPGRNLLVLAGPGSGKTRVVVHRCAYLLRVERVPARAVLVLCFNRNAAFELRRRLRRLVGDDARGVTVCTYHSLAMRLTGTSFAVAAEADAPRREPDFRRLITDAVRLLTDPEAETLSGLGADELRDEILAGYSHILVDEYQDVNAEQYELISALAGRSESDGDRKLAILAVGDDDQNIYGFSGADVGFIRRFRDEYEAEAHYLVESYRSTAHILAAANQLIAGNLRRMKREQPCRVNEARARDDPGGRWSSCASAGHGKVQVIRVADRGCQAAAVAERVFHMKHLEPELRWADCAVLARSHAVLQPIRALLEHRGVPVAWAADRERLPSLVRIREVAAALAVLKEHRREIHRASRLADLCLGPEAPRANPWTRLVAELLEEWREETTDAELAVREALEFLYEALAERAREPILGDGVRLLTVHAAKGLEFRHVLMPDGDWRAGRRGADVEEQRRLYYVGMTRARELLHLYELADAPNPHVASLEGSFLERRAPAIEPPCATLAERRFSLLGQRDLYLSYAGRRPPGDPVHHRLAALHPGDPLVLRRDGDFIELADPDGGDVAALSAEGRRRWADRLEHVEAVRVMAMVERRAESSEGEHRARLRSERWEVPVAEVIWRERA